MKMQDLIIKTRSYRRYRQDKIEDDFLKELVNLGRLSANHKNRQPLKYIISNQKNINNRIFPTLVWAKNISNWHGPAEEERPVSYIVILHDHEIDGYVGQNPGIAAQSIVLGAMEHGIGACMVANIKRDVLRQALDIKSNLEICLVIALGYPKEKIVLDEMLNDDNTKYYRDDDNVHHVPKRRLEDILLS
jgi:nitroreductase